MLFKVNEFVSFVCFMFLGLVSPFKVWFRYSRLRLYSSFNFRRLFGVRQSTARVSLAHVVMSSPASANTAPLELNAVISNDVHDAIEVDDTGHMEFDLSELK